MGRAINKTASARHPWLTPERRSGVKLEGLRFGGVGCVTAVSRLSLDVCFSSAGRESLTCMVYIPDRAFDWSRVCVFF